MLPKPGRGALTARLGSMFRSGSVLDGVLAYLAYATGMALVVGVLAVTTALASSTVARGARWLLPRINRISGCCSAWSGCT